MHDEFFNIDFGRQFLCLIISVPIGLLVGLFINSAWHEQRQKSDKKQMVAVLLAAFEHNKAILSEISGNFTDQVLTTLPTKNTDLVTLSAVTSRKYDSLDYDLCRKIDRTQFELSHLDTRLVMCRNVWSDAASRRAVHTEGEEGVSSVYSKMYPLLSQAAQYTLNEVRPMVDETIAALKAVHVDNDFI